MVSVAWYGDITGAAQKWGDVDPASRARASSILTGLVNSILKLSEDPADDMAQILTRWLQVLSLRDDLVVIDGQPVLTNWGIVPEAIGDNPEALLLHFQAGLGQFLTQGTPDRARLDPVANVSAQSQKAAATSQAPLAEPSAEGGERRRWLSAAAVCSILPVGIACILAMIVLLLLLVPGVLLYSRASLQAIAIDPASLGEAEDVLRQRVEQMRALLAQGSCRAPDQQSRIDSVAPQVLSARPPADTGAAGMSTPPSGPASGMIAGTSLLPPSPSTLRPPGQANAGSIVDLVERATVLVIARERDGKSSTGTGFFVAPQRILTNRHVVETADRNAIYVTNAALSGVRPVKLQSMTDTSDFGASDFALLDLDGSGSPQALSVTTSAAKGDNVLAAGFPSVFMETDPQFQALIQGQQSSAPAMVLTQGIVTVFQTSPSGVPLVLHSADISPGNSGGPLIDYCGRVVGVNTFLRTDSDDQMRLNFALKTDSLLDFLKANHVEVEAPGDACVPVTTASSVDRPATPQSTGP
ncbi:MULTISPECIES: serine protease [Rhizobium]|uniref:Serine protease n=1 Tax=Rhizobium aouanii TaxID=3118145 RepID=A0ABU8CUL8_9HYPH|nr:serine protease [Rhizobium acaciae]MCW1754168.1 serine protease [Rhizobium acaciae]